MTDQPLSPIADSLWWVVPDRLAGVRKPTEDELPTLREMGIQAIVSVLSDDSNLDFYAQAEMPFLWLPVIGGKSPSVEQLQQLKTFVDAQHKLGHAVVIHCSSGRRRTGTMLAALLILEGKSYDEATEIIAAANPAVEMREAQHAFLRSVA